MQSSLWRLIVTFLVIMTVGLTFYLSGATSHLNSNLVIAIIAVQPLNVLSSVFVALRLSTLTGGKAGVVASFKAQNLAAVFLMVIPGRLSEAVKPIYLIERKNLDPAGAFAAVATERVIDIVIVAIAVCLLILTTGGGLLRGALPLLFVLLILIFSAALFLRFYPPWIRRLCRMLPSEKVAAILVALLDHTSENLKPVRLLPAFALGIAGWLCSSLTVFFLIILVSDRPIDLTQGLIVFLASTAGFAISIVPGSVGTYEGAAVAALAYFGFTVSEALALAIGMRIASQGVALIIGASVLAREKIGIKSFIEKTLRYFRPASQICEQSGTTAAAEELR